MSRESLLLTRSGSKCELCSSSTALSVYDVQPQAGSSADSAVLLCQKCLDSAAAPASIDLKHWYALNESMWSEYPAVQVLVYRVLKSLTPSPWASDLLAQLYLDDELQKWADAGVHEAEAPKAEVLDSNGTPLVDGDTVTLIKDLDVKGANFTAKRGTTVKNISLTDDPKFIEGRVNGTRIVLVAAYLKKA